MFRSIMIYIIVCSTAFFFLLPTSKEYCFFDLSDNRTGYTIGFTYCKNSQNKPHIVSRPFDKASNYI